MFQPASLAIAAAALFGLAASQDFVLQAETADLSGTTVGKSVPGFTGTGYVEGFDNPTDKVTFTLYPETTGLYNLNLIYQSPNGDKYTKVVFDNEGGSEVSLPATTNWTTVSAGQVALHIGANIIEIQSDWGGYLLDAITLTRAPQRRAQNVTTTPVDGQATPEARALLKYLGENYGKHIISGQQDQASLDWITANVGKTPAILGIDFMDYTDSRTSRGAKSQEVEHALAFANKGGIVTAVWHWGAPKGLYDTADHPWYQGFYTSASDFNIATALADTTNANYTLILHDIDTIAKQIQRLQDAGVPLLFRALHEASGGWFWWGAHGAKPAIALYRLIYERLTKTHNLHNIIWVWNSDKRDWYPGDDVVDIVSTDMYTQGDHGPQLAEYEALVSLTSGTKIVAAAEVGSVMDPQSLQTYKAAWAYFVLWTGKFVTDPSWNSLDFLKRVYNDAYVLTLDKIIGWQKTV